MRGVNIPALVPVVMTSGQIGWVDYDQLTVGADVTLTSTGVTQAPLTAYGPDGADSCRRRGRLWKLIGA